jgi:hypothetical protein
VERILDLRPAELEGTRFSDLVHEEDLPRLSTFLGRMLDERPAHSGVTEFRVRHGDGSWLHLETSVTNLINEPEVAGLVLNSRDVQHSFWVPAFLEKSDLYPGRTNYLSFTTGREGEFYGKCAELCGEYHSEMLFNVAVVSQAEYDAQMQALRDAGQTGQLGEEYNRDSSSGGVRPQEDPENN